MRIDFILCPIQIPAVGSVLPSLSSINSACLSFKGFNNLVPLYAGQIHFLSAGPGASSPLFVLITHSVLPPDLGPYCTLLDVPSRFPLSIRSYLWIQDQDTFLFFFFLSLCSLLWLIHSFLDRPYLRYTIHLLSLISP